MSKATLHPTKLGESEKDGCSKPNQINLRKDAVFRFKEWWTDAIFILFQSLFDIITHQTCENGKVANCHLYMYMTCLHISNLVR